MVRWSLRIHPHPCVLDLDSHYLHRENAVPRNPGAGKESSIGYCMLANKHTVFR